MAPYREPPDAPRCSTHSAAPAIGGCARCGARVCSPCALYVGLALICPRCTRVMRSHSRLRRVIALGVVLGLMLDGTGFGIAAYARDKRASRHARAPSAAQRLVADPCDLGAIDLRLGELTRAHDLANAVLVARAANECELTADLRTRVFQTHLANNDTRAAIEDMRLLIIDAPSDPDLRCERANLLLRAGRRYEALLEFIEMSRLSADPAYARSRIEDLCASMPERSAACGGVIL